MHDQIICPHCNKAIPLSQALSHELREKYAKEKEADVERIKREMNKEALEWKEQIKGKIRREMDLQMRDKTNEVEELKKQNEQLNEQFLVTHRLIRTLKSENEENRIKMEKKLMEEQEKIRFQERKRLSDEYRLKDLEKEKKLQDALKVNEELKRKLEQGSQQTQGEVLELELESLLRKEFPYDEIQPVPKGVTGADVIQIVKNHQGRVAGNIIWESKRTKVWSEGWISKLKEDQRKMKCDIAVIISQALPSGINNMGEREGVVIGNYDMILGLSVLLRQKLLEVASLKASLVGKQEKKEILWNYLTGNEFKHRLDAVSEAYSEMQDDLEYEKRWFVKKWAKQEKMMRMVIDNMLGMHGDLQSIVGKVLPEIKGMDLLNPPPVGKQGEDTLF